MKRSIEWHKECLANARASARYKRDEAARCIAAAEEIERQCMKRDAQIIRAELKGVTEFDADKFDKQREPQSHEGSK